MAQYMNIITLKEIIEKVEFKYGYKFKDVSSLKYFLDQLEKAYTTDVVAKLVYNNIKWERDRAIQILEENGLKFTYPNT